MGEGLGAKSELEAMKRILFFYPKAYFRLVNFLESRLSLASAIKNTTKGPLSKECLQV